MQTKVCIGKCKKEFPIDDFYKTPNMASGRSNKCKKCKTDEQKETAKKLREERLMYVI